MPAEALSMGIATILQARAIVLIATGAAKASIVERLLRGPVTPELPGSFLQVHPDVEIVLDEAAAAMTFAAERCHIIIEGAAACAVAAARSPRMKAAGHRKIVAVVSGGNIDLSRFASLTGACP